MSAIRVFSLCKNRNKVMLRVNVMADDKADLMMSEGFGQTTFSACHGDHNRHVTTPSVDLHGLNQNRSQNVKHIVTCMKIMMFTLMTLFARITFQVCVN